MVFQSAELLETQRSHSDLSQDRHRGLRFTIADRKGTKGNGCLSED